MLKYSGLVTATLLAAVQGVSAQDLTLEDEPALSAEDAMLLDLIVVKSATRTETPISEATVSVSVVTEDQVQRQSNVNSNIGQILSKTVPGFGQSTENLTEYGQTLRGRNFLTLIDGVPQTNNLNNNYRALNSISTTAIQQIEVVRGATAAYGFGAPGGLVNIITKQPEDGEFNAQISIGIKASPTSLTESFSYLTEAGASGARNGFFYLVNGSWEDTGASFTADGERRPPDSFGTQGGTDDIFAYNFLGKLGYEHENHKIEISANRYSYWQDSDWAGIVSGGSRQSNTSATPSRGNLNTRTPGTDNLTLNGSYKNDDVLGGTFELQSYYNDNTTTFTRTEFFGTQYDQYETESRKIGSRATFDTPFPWDRLPVDIVWGLDVLNDQTKVNPIDGPVDTPKYELTGIAPFAQVRADLFNDRAILSAGVRYEHLSVDISDYVNEIGTSVTGGTLTFREPLFNISGSFDLNDKFTVFGGFSQGFQLGDLGRYLYNSNFTNVSQLSDDGQKTDSYELGVRAIGNNWDASVTGFYNKSDNGVTYDANLDIVLSPEQIWGIEVAANYEATDQITFGGTLTWLEGEYDTDGDGKYDSDLGSDRISPLKLTGYVEYTPWDWANFRLQGLYSGYRNPDSEQFTGLESIDPYFVMDAFADFKVNERSKLSLGVENILNADYVPVLQQSYSVQSYGYDDYYYAKAPGTTFSAKYTVKF
ncbi:MAG: TonB-dependent receptor [Roseibium sp.]|uniref:TonB-dependent receptor n=1 Tax=Roseibium sp. TaxID=1936156 RepID=UPI002628C26F|nr:TonB-dependent receptor [Roseibium sp.]MCV0427853.1 TonB-dependent receptor [Roseibium sp.]